jgi:FMN-dependent NADH-azoreductase
MSKLLYVISSPRGTLSDSSRLAERFLESYRAHRPDLEVDRLDLWHDQLPVYGGAGVDAKMTLIAGGRLEGDQRQAWQEVRQLFERFDAADEYLFAVPMWNAGVPWVLKHLIDTISQPGMMFGFDPTDGYTGLLRGKRAVVAYTSAVYAPAVPARFGSDFHATFFNDWLRFVGIDEISEIRLQATALAADQEAQRSRALDQAAELGLRLALTRSRAA